MYQTQKFNSSLVLVTSVKSKKLAEERKLLQGVILQLVQLSSSRFFRCPKMPEIDSLQIEPLILDMLRHYAPGHDILEAFVTLHKAFDLQILLCYAVHYNHLTFVSRLMSNRLFQLFSVHKPLITAVADRNLQAIELICEKSYVHADDHGYGVIRGNKLLVHQETSALDLAMLQDDVEMLQLLTRNYSGEYEPLAIIAEHYNATKCLQIITHTIAEIVEKKHLNTQHFGFLVTKSCNFAPLDRVVDISCNYYGKVTELQQHNALRLWGCFQRNSTVEPGAIRRFLTFRDTNFIRSLLFDTPFLSSRIFFMQNTKTPPKSTDQFESYTFAEAQSLNLHGRVILDTCQLLLAEEPDDISKHTFSRLTQKVLEILDSSYGAKSCIVGFMVQSMALLNMIVKMFLQHGVTQSPDDKIITLCLRKMDTKPNAAQEQIFKHAQNFVMILLAYGYEKLTVRDCNDLFWIQSEFLLPTVKTCISMMSNDVYNAYIQKVDTERQNLESELKKAPENRNCIKFPKLQKAVENSCNGPRSPQELTRLKIHEVTARGKLPSYVQQLDVSKEMQSYISLGVQPLL